MKKWSQILTALALFFLLGHFAATIVYTSPRGTFPKSLHQRADQYMIPLFHQNWNLFAPEPPKVSRALFFRCETAEGWSEWINPATTFMEGHYSYRVSYHGKLLQANTNLLHYLMVDYYRYYLLAEEKQETEQEKEEFIFEAMEKSKQYKAIIHYLQQYLAWKMPEQEWQSIEFYCEVTIPPPYKERTTASPELQRIKFPIYSASNN